jgi:hypothetical protein
MPTGLTRDQIKANTEGFERLCTAIGVPVDVADTIASGLSMTTSTLKRRRRGRPDLQGRADSVLAPAPAELSWYGIDPKY